jgi:hypothetical protein
VWSILGCTDRANRKYSEEDLSHCQIIHHISHGLTRDRIRTSAVTGQRLTARAMARPAHCNRNCLLDSQNNITLMLHCSVPQTVAMLSHRPTSCSLQPQPLDTRTVAVFFPICGHPNRNVTTNVKAVRSFKTSASIQ